MTAVEAVAMPEPVARALASAARKTGTGFDYLVETARRESGFDSAAAAPTSSAVGLFQFVEETWMATLKSAGPKHGLGEAAAAIRQTPSGRHDIADPDTKAAILALRTVPEAAALMAGELTRANAQSLQDRIGREPTAGELYIAHFLGAGGAARLIRIAGETPDVAAAAQFPAAARANPSIFYARGGQARSAAAVHQVLTGRYDGGAVHAVASGPLDITPDRARSGLPTRIAETRAPAAADPAGAVPVAAYASGNGTFANLYRPVAGAGESRSEALVSTLRAYGADVPAARRDPADPPASSGGPGRSAPLWGGGLFTNAAPRNTAPLHSLFSTAPPPNREH